MDESDASIGDLFLYFLFIKVLSSVCPVAHESIFYFVDVCSLGEINLSGGSVLNGTDCLTKYDSVNSSQTWTSHNKGILVIHMCTHKHVDT